MNERWQYTCPKCNMCGGGEPNMPYKCHRAGCDGIMLRSSNGRIYPDHGSFDKNCDCKRCCEYYKK